MGKLIAAGLCAKAADGRIRLSADLRNHPRSDGYLDQTIIETRRLAENLTLAGMDLERPA
ncbi:hypothetical protein GALL_427760 [mine drainage metagenome]|uniref:Uncharacterized protein n=1 Tax=mine drainage metagenome TaxID=410659 RepID=A0A1J5PXC5_9ZZZZ